MTSSALDASPLADTLDSIWSGAAAGAGSASSGADGPPSPGAGGAAGSAAASGARWAPVGAQEGCGKPMGSQRGSGADWRTWQEAVGGLGKAMGGDGGLHRSLPDRASTIPTVLWAPPAGCSLGACQCPQTWPAAAWKAAWAGATGPTTRSSAWQASLGP